MPILPEMRLLASCLPCATSCDSIGPHAGAEDFSTVDWRRLIDLAGWHGMVPLLASRLPATGRAASAPSEVLSQLKARQNGYLARSLTQLAALAELQRAFDRGGLRVVAWKGPSTGLLLYGSATLRESADLDFLLLEKDVRSVLTITRELGYELLGSSRSESRDLYILTQQREFTFGRRSDQTVLEFHLQIMPGRFALWQDSPAEIERADTYVDLGDVRLLLQRPEDLLVSLCAHANKHNWERLKWSADIVQFLKLYGSTLDWEPLLNELRVTGKHLVVLLGLSLAESIYGVALPPAVTRALQRTAPITALAEEVTRRVMSGEKESGDTRYRKALADLLCPRTRDRFVYRIQPIVELNYEDLYVPVHRRMLFFLNYIFRIFRLLRKYGPHRLASKTAGSVRSVH